MSEPGSVGLRVIETAADAAAVTDAQGDGASLGAGAAIAQLGGLLGNGVHGGGDEVDKLDLRHRTHASKRGADGGADDDAFCERRVDDAVWAELFDKSLGGLEGATHHADVFADDEDVFVAAHFFAEG